MKIESVFDSAFAPYGKVLPGYDTAELLAALEKYTPLPEATDYVPSQPELEALPIAAQLAANAYGGMPIQLGWCNGHNTRLNCLEYHRDSEINCGTEDFILLVAREDDIVGGVLDTDKVRAFRAPRGVMVEVYATTLHYAPCSAGPPARHQRPQAGNHAPQRRGQAPLGLQQVAPGPRRERRGRPGRRRRAQGRQYRHRERHLTILSKRCIENAHQHPHR